jgi:hypothetical protein
MEWQRNRMKTEEGDRIKNEERGLDEECGMQREAGWTIWDGKEG